MITKNTIYVAGLLISAVLSSTPLTAAPSGICETKKPSTCQGSWKLQVKNRTDACYMYVFGHRVNGKYTVPSGYRHLNHPSNHGWKLRIDDSGRRDYWIKRNRCS